MNIHTVWGLNTACPWQTTIHQFVGYVFFVFTCYQLQERILKKCCLLKAKSEANTGEKHEQYNYRSIEALWFWCIYGGIFSVPSCFPLLHLTLVIQSPSTLVNYQWTKPTEKTNWVATLYVTYIYIHDTWYISLYFPFLSRAYPWLPSLLIFGFPVDDVFVPPEWHHRSPKRSGQ